MAVVAVAASITTATVILGYQGSQRRRRTKQLKDDHRLFSHPTSDKSNRPDSSGVTRDIVQPSGVAPGAQLKREKTKIEFDEELVSEQLARNIAFLGEEGVQKLRNSFVIVVGAGGVGSWAASMLIKSGIGRIRIVDYDHITLSGLNQHATANRADIGTPKAIAMKQYFRTIAPWVEVDARVECLQKDSAERLLSGNPDYVVDAIGDLTSKVQLLKYCYDHKIPVMSSMEAGAKADPSRVQISDISETFEDPLARAVRRRLKKVGIDTGIEVVFSTEKPHKARPSDQGAAQSGNTTQESSEYRPLPNYQSNLLPVLGPLPAMFGMSMATFITCKIAGWAMDPFPVKFRMELYQRLHRDLKAQEETLYPGSGDIKLDRRDVGYVVEEMFRGKSAISQSMDRLAVCRWRRDLPLSLLNAVVMTEKEMERHLALPVDADLETVYGKDIVEYVKGQYREEELINNL
ncbi:hypothetical protein BGZ80_011352 [Entomortierella chlamydospora]|uniref:THIF-type NAD/FAD binding fold domain-containing protein n=1 Tax=Entomortierella chlamydospora TaxID=101097 RepID=A0A9P6MU94_9FUNG|nr:hypothetical protein BGZ79_010137 [Entomortierella chlamydospora]KAG0013032.1 hypothetical protein BGZ80_011352 [Entomortierella chlamydospora]